MAATLLQKQSVPWLGDALALVAVALTSLAIIGQGGEAGWAGSLIVIAGAVGIGTTVVGKVDVPPRLWWAGLAWCAFSGWCLVQSLPLPGLAHPLWAESAHALRAAGTGSIALDPFAAVSDAYHLLSLVGFAALGLYLTRRGWMGGVTAFIVACIALCAILALLLAAETSGDALKIRHAADATFPFTSRNTFCAFAGVAVICGAVRLAELNRAGFNARTIFWLAVVAAGTAGVIGAHSRAGLAAVALGTFCGIAMMTKRRRLLIVTLLLIGLVVLVSFAGITGIRASELPEDWSIRAAIWQSAAELAWQHLWLGVGNFDHAVQMAPGDWGDRHILHAHNIYLQAIAERGLPASLLACVAVYLMARASLPPAGPPATPSALSPTAIGVGAMFALHGLVDFSIYAPVNAAFLALLLGMACGRTHAAESSPPGLPIAALSATTAPNPQF
jgi:O-antigen ligase